jgi:hypothetical protein
MKTKKRRRSAKPRTAGALRALPLMFGQMAAASVETIGRRTRLMAGGTCSPAEYRRMLQEKIEAVQESAAALASARDGRGLRAAIDPFHRRVTANARRLRRKGA